MAINVIENLILSYIKLTIYRVKYVQVIDSITIIYSTQASSGFISTLLNCYKYYIANIQIFSLDSNILI